MPNSILPYQLVGKQGNTIETILYQSIQLLSKRGYSATSLQDIANACHIKKSSLFHYVRNKPQLVGQVLQSVRNHY